MRLDPQLLWLLAAVVAALMLASLIGFALSRMARSESARATVENLNARIRSWWVMCAIVALTIFIGQGGSLVLFAGLSFLALREFITLTPTRRADHRVLFWTFFVFTPLQYLLIGIRWYGLFIILIPVYAFLYIPTRIALEGDTTHFLERTAKIQWGLMICVYCLGYAPALLTLNIPGYQRQGTKLLLYLAIVDQMSDVLQYVFGKLFGRHKVAPEVSPNKTWEGLVLGIAGATAIGVSLSWVTPFTPLQSLMMALLICILGYFGGLTMSAIKRDRGVKDYGSVIRGHGGILDRIDSLCFSAPIFFHFTRFFFTPPISGSPIQRLIEALHGNVKWPP